MPGLAAFHFRVGCGREVVCRDVSVLVGCVCFRASAARQFGAPGADGGVSRPVSCFHDAVQGRESVL